MLSQTQCEVCCKPAEVHLTQMVDGKPTEHHYCMQHGREKGVGQEMIALDDVLRILKENPEAQTAFEEVVAGRPDLQRPGEYDENWLWAVASDRSLHQKLGEWLSKYWRTSQSS